jgi:nucleoside-diphosphate-sugar epimerase
MNAEVRGETVDSRADATASSLAGRRVLVTGATGFVGRHLVRALAAAGAEVHALRRASSAGAAFSGSRPVATGPAPVVWHEADLLDRKALARALATAAPAIVFHLAAYGARPEERGRDAICLVNVQGSVNLWEALPESVTRVVAAGTSREYARATGPVDEEYRCHPWRAYPASKHAAGVLLAALAEEDGRSLVILRLFGPYGPGDDSQRVIPFTILRLLASESVPLTSGGQLYDFAFVDDHVAGFLLAATVPLPRLVSIYNIGSGEPRALREVLEAVAATIGGSALARLRFGAHPERPGDNLAICADIGAARRDLGYAPTTPLADGLARTVEWWRARSAPVGADQRGGVARYP